MKYLLNIFLIFLPMFLCCQSNTEVPTTGVAKTNTFDHENQSRVFNEVKPNLSHIANIASATEPGERIKITGIVYESDGRTPAKDVQIYFYHTNAKGIYAKRGDEPRDSYAWWHGYNSGMLTTNNSGEYEINTIKPAPYPSGVEPAHIHVIVKSPSQKTAYDVGAITFKGDQFATSEYWYNVEQHGHPRDGGTLLTREGDIKHGKRNFVLYAQYDIASSNSGLIIGEECPAFTPAHAFGYDKGSKACPMCKYGNGQGVMAWVNHEDWDEIKKLAQFLEARIAENGLQNLRAFIIYMNPARLPQVEVSNKLVALAKDAQLKNVALLYIPSPDDSKTSVLYRLNTNDGVRNTVFVYKGRRVADKYVNLGTTQNELEMLYRSTLRTMHK